MIKKILVIMLLVAVLSISGCTQPDNVNPNSGNYEKIINKTATDDNVKITIQSIRVTDKIDEKDNKFYVITTTEGMKYLIANVTIENLQTKKINIGTMFFSSVHSNEGEIYNQLFSIQANFLANPLPLDKNADLQPNSQVTGDVPYEISADATGLKIVYMYEDKETGYKWTAEFEI